MSIWNQNLDKKEMNIFLKLPTHSTLEYIWQVSQQVLCQTTPESFFVWSAKSKLQFNFLQFHLIRDGDDKFFTTCVSNFMYINVLKETDYPSKSATQTIKIYKYFRVDYTKITVQKENVLTNLKFWLRVGSLVLSFCYLNDYFF